MNDLELAFFSGDTYFIRNNILAWLEMKDGNSNFYHQTSHEIIEAPLATAARHTELPSVWSEYPTGPEKKLLIWLQLKFLVATPRHYLKTMLLKHLQHLHYIH